MEALGSRTEEMTYSSGRKHRGAEVGADVAAGVIDGMAFDAAQVGAVEDGFAADGVPLLVSLPR